MPDKKILKGIIDTTIMPPEGKEELSHIFDLQREFGSKWCNFNSTDYKYKREWMNIFSVCMLQELSEILDWLPWKHWKKYDDFQFDHEEIRLEIIDLLHFVVSQCLLLGVTPKNIQDEVVGQASSKFLKNLLIVARGRLMVAYPSYPDDMDDMFRSRLTQEAIGAINVIVAFFQQQKDYSEAQYFRACAELMLNNLQLCALWGLDTERQVYAYYVSKNRENHARQRRGY